MRAIYRDMAYVSAISVNVMS